MRNWNAAVAAALALSALALPPVLAQDAFPALGIANPRDPANVTLYFHINGFQQFPINTQPPADLYKQDAGVGITTASSTCGGLSQGTPANKEFHTSYGYSSPGYVEYNFTPDGTPRIHPERGLSYDIRFDGEGFNLYWYLSTQTGLPAQPQADPNTIPVVVPNVVVRATLRTGDNVTVDDSGYNDGLLIAQGQTAPALLARDATTGARWAEVEGQNVYEFVVPMALQADTIPKDGGYSLRVDTFLDNPHCGDPSQSYLMPNLVRVHTSPEFRPRMEPRIHVPVRIEYMHPQFIFEDLVVHTSMNSPWGNYDVDESAGGIELSIEGPAGPGICAVDYGGRGCYRAAVVQRYHEHDHHTEAVDVSFVWPFRADQAPDGEYTIHLKVHNDQRTATAYGTAKFLVGPELKVTRCGGLEAVTNVNVEEGCVDELQDPEGNLLERQGPASPWSQVAPVLAFVAVALLRRQRA